MRSYGNMSNPSLGGHIFVNRFVAEKLHRFASMDRSFSSLFELMFSEKENILYERSEGYRIVKTSYGEARRELICRADALKKALAACPRDAVVGLYMDNSLAWMETFWAILCAGFRPLLMNLRLDEETLESALRQAGAVAVVSDGRRFSLPTLSAESLCAGEEVLPDTPFGSELLVMSSGTSAHVKLCAYSAEEIYWQICDSYQIIRRCRAIKSMHKGQLKLLAMLPFYHIFGLTAMYIWFAFFSRTFVQLNDLAPQTIVNTVCRHEVTHIFSVPLFWNRTYDQAIRTIRGRGEKTWVKFSRALALSRKLARIPLLGALFSRLAFREVRDNLFGDSIRFLITGGSAIRPEVLAFFNGIGYRLANGYGASEIGISSVELSASSRWLDQGFVGKPMSSLEYRINENGELLVRGRAVARYVLDGEEKRPAGDWFNTHDLAECVGGHTRILGRRDDLVIGPNGENLNPNRIEDLLRSELVNELCLIQGQEPTLLISVPKSAGAAALAQREAAISRRLGELGLAGQICRIVPVGEPLMREDEFKLNRRRLREDYLAGRLAPVSPAPADSGEDDELVLALRDAMAAVLGKSREQVGAEADFFLELGGSSLDYFALISALREEYGIDFPAEGGSSLSTAKALGDYIRAVGTYGN